MNVRTYALSLWELLDPIYFCLTRLHYLEEKRKCILRVRKARYKGNKITLTDGTIINRNDKLLKIHLHNIRLLKEMKDIKNETRRAFYVYNRVKDSLPFLAAYLVNHKDEENIKGVIGITMLNKGAKRLGFEIHPIRNRLFRNFKRSSALTIHFLSSKSSLKETLKQENPAYLVMSKEILLQKYKEQKNEFPL